MFAELWNRLTGAAEAQKPLPELDARRALGALLVRIAKSDGEYAAVEIAHIDKVLAARYGLNVVEAAKLRAESEKIEKDAPDTVRFTRVLKEAVPHDERLGVMEALWDIVLADGIRASEEDALMRTIAPLLGITDPESAAARRKIEARRDGGSGAA